MLALNERLVSPEQPVKPSSAMERDPADLSKALDALRKSLEN
jgi:hypothetical protein